MERTLHTLPASNPFWLSLYALLCNWHRNHRTRRQLACLNAQQLADTGISEAERLCELEKPFWR